MILRVEAALSTYPSSTTIFRDTTLFANVFCEMEVLLECQPGTRSYYWKFLKSKGAQDFVSDLVRVGEEPGFFLGRKNANIRVDRLDYENFDFVRQAIYALKS
tara:strand:+ start:203 stop:511 length:309 start_codon:yes stop_codon:yes gene_type:complete